MSEPAFQKGDRVQILALGGVNDTGMGTVTAFRAQGSHEDSDRLIRSGIEYLVFPDDGSNPDWYDDGDLRELDAITRLGEIK